MKSAQGSSRIEEMTLVRCKYCKEFAPKEELHEDKYTGEYYHKPYPCVNKKDEEGAKEIIAPKLKRKNKKHQPSGKRG